MCSKAESPGRREVPSVKILVTGAAGFIGSNIVRSYLSLGHEVVGFDNLDRGSRARLPEDVRFILGDLRKEDIFTAIRKIKPEVISHHGGLPSPRESISHPGMYISVNFNGTVNVAMAARRFGVKRIIYGSAAFPIYALLDKDSVNEEDLPLPDTPYGVSVASSEMFLRTLEPYGIQIVSLRYSNVYGEGQSPYGGGIIAMMIERTLKGQMVVVRGDGNQKRDFMYISDAVKANNCALEFGEGERFNISTGVNTDLRSLYRVIERVCGMKGDVVFSGDTSVSINHPVLENSKAWKVLGWAPGVELEEGVKRMVKKFVEKGYTV